MTCPACTHNCRQGRDCPLRIEDMTKNAFDWNNGTPSIWQRDRELKKLLIGQAWGRQTQAKIGLESKAQVTAYSHAKPNKVISS